MYVLDQVLADSINGSTLFIYCLSQLIVFWSILYILIVK